MALSLEDIFLAEDLCSEILVQLNNLYTLELIEKRELEELNTWLAEDKGTALEESIDPEENLHIKPMLIEEDTVEEQTMDDIKRKSALRLVSKNFYTAINNVLISWTAKCIEIPNARKVVLKTGQLYPYPQIYASFAMCDYSLFLSSYTARFTEEEYRACDWSIKFTSALQGSYIYIMQELLKVASPLDIEFSLENGDAEKAYCMLSNLSDDFDSNCQTKILNLLAKGSFKEHLIV